MGSTARSGLGSGEPRPVRPGALMPVVAVVGGQSLLLFLSAARLLVGLVTSRVESPGAAIMLAALFVGGGVWLLLAARDLWRGRRWPRAAALTAQLFTVTLAVAVLLPVNALLAAVVVAAAVVAGGSLFRDPVVEWTTQEVPPHRR